jgi:Tfp pilus assembly protein PilF
LLQNTNRLSEAEPLLQRTLAISEKFYDPDHPQVAAVLNNLALLLRTDNRPGDAAPLYRRSLAILGRSTRATGRQHPYLETTRNNYVQALTALGRSEAEIEATTRSLLDDS